MASETLAAFVDAAVRTTVEVDALARRFAGLVHASEVLRAHPLGRMLLRDAVFLAERVCGLDSRHPAAVSSASVEDLVRAVVRAANDANTLANAVTGLVLDGQRLGIEDGTVRLLSEAEEVLYATCARATGAALRFHQAGRGRRVSPVSEVVAGGRCRHCLGPARGWCPHFSWCSDAGGQREVANG